MNDQDITLNLLKKLYPVGSFYCAGIIWLDTLESAKQKLPKFGEWEYIGSDSFTFIFKRTK